MATSVDVANFKDIALVLGTIAVAAPVGARLGVNPVLAVLGAGFLFGPQALGQLSDIAPWLDLVTVRDEGRIALLADAGVVFLMFMIGLELSFERLWTLRKLVYGLGVLQVLVTGLALTAILAALGLRNASALIIGFALALSSTAIVVQILAGQKRLGSATGRASFAVLLFQDVAVVPLLALIGVLSARDGGSLVEGLALAGLKAVVAIALIFGIGRYLLRPLFRSVARMRSAEFFMAASLLTVIGTGMVTAASGLSMALGAFIAGLILAETEFRREVEATIEPFKGLLIGVFFFSVGLSLDLKALAREPLLVLGGLAGLLLVKGVILWLLARLVRIRRLSALEIALLMAPAGEFAFVVVGLARDGALIKPDVAQIAIVVASLSMVLTPLLAALGRRIALAAPAPVRAEAAAPEPGEEAPAVIIAGFGRVGEMVSEMLEEHRISYVAVEGDPDLVARGRGHGHKVWFGDAARIETLERFGLATAKVLVMTMDSRKGVEAIAAGARARRPDLAIIARARDPRHVGTLYEMGVSEAVPEALEASLHISEATLIGAGVPLGLAIAAVHDRRDRYREQFRAMDRGQRLAPAARVRARREARRPSGQPPPSLDQT